MPDADAKCCAGFGIGMSISRSTHSACLPEPESLHDSSPGGGAEPAADVLGAILPLLHHVHCLPMHGHVVGTSRACSVCMKGVRPVRAQRVVAVTTTGLRMSIELLNDEHVS